MAKKINWLGILVIVLLFGTTIIGCGIINLVPEVARGYDQVKWGSSPEHVRNIYNIGSEIQLTQGDTEGVTRLIQKDVSDIITKREYLFHNDRLYRVWVDYASDINPDDISATLTEKYGDGILEEKPSTQTITSSRREARTTSIPMPRGTTTSGHGYSLQPYTYYEDVPYTTTKNVTNYSKYFNKYSPNIEVELRYGETWSTQVCYTWKIERDKFIEKPKVEL